jgi:hypothetical protein
VMTDGPHGRAAGRCGLGAVMGAKNLKAMAVFGKKKIPIARRDKLFKDISYGWDPWYRHSPGGIGLIPHQELRSGSMARRGSKNRLAIHGRDHFHSKLQVCRLRLGLWKDRRHGRE